MKEKDGNEGFDIKDIYTPLSVAKKEIRRRWNDKELRKKVEDFLGGDVPEILKREPRAVLSRDVIGPNNEFFYFWDLSNGIGIKPGFLEYLDGKFVAKNLNKYHLCRMFFHNGNGKKGGEKISTCMVVDFNKSEGKKIKDIETTAGGNFVNFHHKILKEDIPEIDMKTVFDFSIWFNKHRKISEYYYLHYLALFLVHGVLFDNFIMSKGEKEFTKNKILPSFRKLTKIFGIKPIIVPLTPIEDEDGLYWWCYPHKIKDIAKNNL